MKQEKTKEEHMYSDIEKKLLKIQSLRQHIEYISNKEKTYFGKVVEKSIFLNQAYSNAVNLVFIEICKLLNHKESNNFVQYVNGLLKDFDSIEWYNEITKLELREQKKALKKIVNSQIFRKIKQYRNLYLAHDDPNKDEHHFTINFEETWSMVEEIQKIYNYINYRLNNNTLYFQISIAQYELESLEKYREIYEYIFECYKNRQFEIKTTILLDKMQNI